MRYLLIIFLTLSLYAQETCYTVQIKSVYKEDKTTDDFSQKEYDSSCKVMEIGQNVAVRCGCYERYADAKKTLPKFKAKYKNAYVMSTYKSRFASPESIPVREPASSIQNVPDIRNLQAIPALVKKKSVIAAPPEEIVGLGSNDVIEVKRAAKKKKRNKTEKKSVITAPPESIPVREPVSSIQNVLALENLQEIPALVKKKSVIAALPEKRNVTATSPEEIVGLGNNDVIEVEPAAKKKKRNKTEKRNMIAAFPEKKSVIAVPAAKKRMTATSPEEIVGLGNNEVIEVETAAKKKKRNKAEKKSVLAASPEKKSVIAALPERESVTATSPEEIVGLGNNEVIEVETAAKKKRNKTEKAKKSKKLMLR